MRISYTLSEKEIQTLLYGMVNHGAQETFGRMKERAKGAMITDQYVDELFMDMHDGMLKRAREFVREKEDEDGKELQATLYELAAMLRRIAHDVNRLYNKQDKKRNKTTNRFLKLVSTNPNIPERIW